MADKDEPNFDDFELLGDEHSLESLPDFAGLDDLSAGAMPEPVETTEPAMSPEPLEGSEIFDTTEPIEEPMPVLAGEHAEELAESVGLDEAVAESPEVDKPAKASRAAAAKNMLDRLPGDPGWLGIAGTAVLFVLLWLVGMMYISTAIFLIAIAAVCYGMWIFQETNTIYTAILGVALIAVLTSVYCLWTELGSYNFDRKARQLHPGVGVVVSSKQTLV